MSKDEVSCVKREKKLVSKELSEAAARHLNWSEGSW